jgi:hypothetical protein
MKLRIKGNSIRLRLQRGEIATLHDTGSVTEALTLGPAEAFSYTVARIPGDAISLQRDAGGICIGLPAAWALALATTDRVGYDSTVRVAPSVDVRVVVEKDFQCLVVRPEEDESDSFPNPA